MFDCVVIGNRERPVVISASTEPRVLLREKWSGIPDLVIAFVWLAQNCIIMAEYKDVASVLGSALKTKSFTRGSKYYSLYRRSAGWQDRAGWSRSFGPDR